MVLYWGKKLIFQKDIKKIKKKKKRACILFQNKIKVFLLFQRSSVVEQSAVNRSVVGSSPTAGAIKRGSLSGSFFLCVLCVKVLRKEMRLLKNQDC